MAKKAAKRRVVHRKKEADFFGYKISDNPVFVISVGVLIISVIVLFVQYLGR